eukprot:CAMPEP_0204587742 /NCGR_PEP_ID=MMETSP0661-20131031/48225_1 /ASSEMBLY_ACC=CAM_ASM_000606 /TAXON_ID=109239 /ORGANISM="Alexandrium margalefi, Strain AMGDE01CS-322" /LENGTH=53 /DNA_ID=CAMNT_0051597491 /DNA_START=268 /DNA_END=429 /DNA_ORIENTATION=-
MMEPTTAMRCSRTCCSALRAGMATPRRPAEAGTAGLLRPALPSAQHTGPVAQA